MPTIGASNEELDRALVQIGEHNEYARTRYRVVQDKLVRRHFRPLLVDRSTVELGERVETRSAAAKEERQKNTRAINRAQRLVRERGINVRVNTKNAERATAAAELVREVYSDSTTTGASE